MKRLTLNLLCHVEPPEKPSIDLSQIKDITVKAGQSIKIALPLKGWPVPKATWTNDGKPIDDGGRNKIEVRWRIILNYE